MSDLRSDSVSIEVKATPDEVYAAFTSGERLMSWMPPKGMTGKAHVYDFKTNGRYKFELTYDKPSQAGGKSTAESDISNGRFITIDPGRRIVQAGAFESKDAPTKLADDMTITWLFEAKSKGTQITVIADNVPPEISKEDHISGLSSTLANLKAYLSKI